MSVLYILYIPRVEYIPIFTFDCVAAPPQKWCAWYVVHKTRNRGAVAVVTRCSPNIDMHIAYTCLCTDLNRADAARQDPMYNGRKSYVTRRCAADVGNRNERRRERRRGRAGFAVYEYETIPRPYRFGAGWLAAIVFISVGCRILLAVCQVSLGRRCWAGVARPWPCRQTHRM